MSKDPAFLFYPGDWLGGTMTMTRYHKGAYMDVLMAQFNEGHMSIQQIKTVLGEKDEHLWEEVLKKKFIEDASGLFYNEKLEGEIIKRKNFTESRRKNLSHMDNHMDSHMGVRMENENENENRNDNKKGSRKKKEQTVFTFPEDIDKDIWKAFEEMRKKKKAPMTNLAAKLICDELEKIHRETGQDKNEVLKKSVKSSWTDVYPLKDQPAPVAAPIAKKKAFIMGGDGKYRDPKTNEIVEVFDTPVVPEGIEKIKDLIKGIGG
jgi:hypothetical protein